MALPAAVPVFSPEKYLRWETSQMEMQEFVAEKVFATGGATRRQVELFRKGADGLWVLHDFLPDQAVQLASVESAVSWERLFRNVD